jgi:hypothetical protein
MLKARVEGLVEGLINARARGGPLTVSAGGEGLSGARRVKEQGEGEEKRQATSREQSGEDRTDIEARGGWTKDERGEQQRERREQKTRRRRSGRTGIDRRREERGERREEPSYSSGCSTMVERES